MARICESPRLSPFAVCLLMIVMVVVIDLVAASDGSIYNPDVMSQEEGHATFPDSQPRGLLGAAMSKDDIRRELLRQLLILQEAEENILSRIRQLEAERRAVSSRKRSHYSSMCMFNVVACYRK